MNWFVYILKCRDGTLYTGITNNIKKRIKAHKEGKGAKYTKGRGPFELIFEEKYLDKSSALKREAVIKQLRREDKLILSQEFK
mgnify:FL=1